MGRAYVGLGSNLGDRSATLRRALALLAARPDLELLAVSTFSETEPVGYLDQPAFINAVAAFETTLAPHALLSALLDVETELGRTRDGPRYGPRTVDLDVLLIEGVTVDTGGLTVPHPRLHERAFALAPLVELDPLLIVPGHGPVGELLERLESGR